MKKIITVLIILSCNLTYSQNEKRKFEFRQLTGILLDNTGLPLPGQTIAIKGTTIGTKTNFDGIFCLIVPKKQTIFIELLYFGDFFIREIEPNINNIELIVGSSSDRISNKAFRKWKKTQTKYNSDLYLFYNNSEYIITRESICR
jgi:hypothetical protein